MAKEDIKEVIELLQQGVHDVYDSDRYKNFLNTMSKFHTYSLNNQLLINMQCPQATRVAGYNKWKKEFNRQVKAGERGINIIAPYTYTVDVPTDQTDEYGNVIYEKENRIGYKGTYVFDISQTSGEELPELVEPLCGDVSEFNKLFNVLVSISNFDIGFEDMNKGYGYCDHTSGIIRVKPNLSQAQTIKTLIHEIVHERMHEDRDTERSQREVEAESVAYIVCSSFNLDTSEYSFGYVAGWAKSQDSQILMDSLSRIKLEANTMIQEIENGMEKSVVNDIETDIKQQAEMVLYDAGADATVDSVHVISVTEKKQIMMHVHSDYYGYDAEFKIKDISRDKIVSLLQSEAQYDYLDNYLMSNGATIEITPTQEGAEYDMDYTLDTMTLTVNESTPENVSAIIEYSGSEKEDNIFNILNSSNIHYMDVTVDSNPVGTDIGLVEPFTERLEKYEQLEYNASWPMVSIVYSNVHGMIPHRININEAVAMVNKLDESEILSPGSSIRIKINYVYNDWEYEHAQELPLWKGKMNFIDYLKLPPNIISHLKAHNSVMEKCKQALHYAPDTTYGNEYSDKMLDWSTYCRMELNHNSDKPVIPQPPPINELYNINDTENWRIDR